MTEAEIKQQICDIGKRIYDRGMVAANDGNISVKISDNEFLCTPTGVSKGFMTPNTYARLTLKARFWRQTEISDRPPKLKCI